MKLDITGVGAIGTATAMAVMLRTGRANSC